MKIAVVAYSKKTVGGGLPELRAELKRRGQSDVSWYEVAKSRKVPKAARAALADGPDLLLVWGGDGTVQRAVDVLARTPESHAAVGVIPAGTSNLFAGNLGIPHDLAAALDVALGDERKVIDVGSFNGERFGVMAGVGLDALMIGDASRSLKDRLAASPTSTRASRTCAGRRSRHGSTSTASPGSAVVPAACWSATWATCSAVSRSSQTPIRPTATWMSASFKPRSSPTGRAWPAERSPATWTARRSSPPPRPEESTCG